MSPKGEHHFEHRVVLPRQNRNEKDIDSSCRAWIPRSEPCSPHRLAMIIGITIGMIVTGITIITAIGTVSEAIGVTTSTIMNSSKSARLPLKQGAETDLLPCATPDP